MITLLDKLKTIVLQFANLHDKLNLIDEDDIKTLEESVIYISELEEERDKYRNMIFDKEEQLTKAKEIIKKYYKYNPSCEYFYEDIDKEAEQFLKENE